MDDDKERFCASAWPRLVAAVSHYCGDVHVAEELVQEALVRACRRWGHVSSLSSPEGWTYRVAVNLANSAWRRRRAERAAHRRRGPQSDVQSAVAVEDQLLVRDALARLTDVQRETVILRFLLDFSVERTAVVLGTTPGAVRGTTHRAVTHLRDTLGAAAPMTERVHDVP